MEIPPSIPYLAIDDSLQWNWKEGVEFIECVPLVVFEMIDSFIAPKAGVTPHGWIVHVSGLNEGLIDDLELGVAELYHGVDQAPLNVLDAHISRSG